jgi:hypothetical protein
MFSSQEEYSFSLTQLMVVLDKPIGLTLAPDPTTGHVYVQHIEAGMSAADSRLVLVRNKSFVFNKHTCFVVVFAMLPGMTVLFFCQRSME